MLQTTAHRFLPGGMPAKRWCEAKTPGTEEGVCGLRLPCPDHDRHRSIGYADPADTVDFGND